MGYKDRKYLALYKIRRTHELKMLLSPHGGFELINDKKILVKIP